MRIPHSHGQPPTRLYSFWGGPRQRDGLGVRGLRGKPIEFAATDGNGRGRRLQRPGWRTVFVVTSLVAFTVLSVVGKIANQYGFFIYPDSYYYLLIAENMREHFHPTGTLGAGGMPFPPPGYAAMKVTYPVIVSAALAFGVPTEAAGHLITTGAAVLCVPAAHWATVRLTQSRRASLMAALLAATSYGLTYWSGFIMSDSVSILLAFVTLALFAKERPRGWGNPGDLALGLSLAALLLSRPTYIVAIPFLAWLGVRRWGWGVERGVTAIAAVALTASTAAFLWFPPSSFSGMVLGNLMPLLAGVGLLAGVALLVARRLAHKGAGEIGDATGLALAMAGAVLLAAVYAAERITDATGSSFYLGLGRFAVRDVATLVALLPGSWMLAKARRWDVAFALNATAFALLIVYFWAEPRESRYVTHLLPFLIPVASAVTLLVTRERFAAVGARKTAVAWVSAAVLVAVAFSVGVQARESARTADAHFLDSAYPREVSKGLVGRVPPDVTVLSALPWPYYFHLRRTTWGAGVIYSADSLHLLPQDKDVFILEDASLRFHDRRIAAAVGKLRRPIVEFSVPLSYQYGYSSVADPEPIRGYLATPAELSSVIESATAQGGGEAAGQPQ